MGVFERYIVTFMRTYLGAFNFASGLNFFILFYPQPIPADPLGRAYMGATLDMGLFQLAKVIELVGGLLLLTNTATPFALVLLAPVTANIFVMNTFNSPMAHVQVSGARNFAFHFLLFAAYAQHFFGLLRINAPLAPLWRTYKRMKDHF